jgi:hypothetical protein
MLEKPLEDEHKDKKRDNTKKNFEMILIEVHIIPDVVGVQ